jgi:hypothetical protein
VGILAAAVLSGCQWDETRFYDLRVVNDTHRPVKIQPCWDVDCVDMNGMPVTVLRPGDSRDEKSWWVIPASGVAVAVLSPAGHRIIGCLILNSRGRSKGVVRTSQQRPCFHR